MIGRRGFLAGLASILVSRQAPAGFSNAIGSGILMPVRAPLVVVPNDRLTKALSSDVVFSAGLVVLATDLLTVKMPDGFCMEFQGLGGVMVNTMADVRAAIAAGKLRVK